MLLKKNAILGNQPTLQQFSSLRNPVFSVFRGLKTMPYNMNPQVLYWYGSGMVLPQKYYVAKCDFNHEYFNALGYPQKTDISMELILDETSKIYLFERYARSILSVLGLLESVVTTVKFLMGARKPYNLNTFTIKLPKPSVQAF
jgi:hypothetical protein